MDCFTGDLFISPLTEKPLSLFGEDAPIIGSYSPIPPLPAGKAIAEIVRVCPGVAIVVSQISGYALLDAEGSKSPVVLFGVDGDDYFKAFNSVRLVRGSLLRTAMPGMMLSEEKVKEISSLIGHDLVLGAPLQVSVFTNHGFSIREVPFTGSFEFPTSNSVLDRIAYVDADTLRSLNDLIQRNASVLTLPAETRKYLDGDLGSIFDSATGSKRTDAAIRLSDVEEELARKRAQQNPTVSDQSSWNFLLIKLKPGVDPRSVKSDLEAKIRSQGLEARVGDWRAAAGSGSALAGSLTLAFNVGLLILAVVIVFVLANSFVTVVAERTSEIATMRAMGASKGVVRSLLFGEVTLLSAAAGAAGAIAGAILVTYLHHRGFPTTNRILTLIFGGSTLRPLLTLRVLAWAFLGALAVGAAASLFAVRLALRIEPAQAMESE